jgi:hypothetical protein
MQILNKLPISHVRYKLEALDLIEKNDNYWRIVDPVFAVWLLDYT